MPECTDLPPWSDVILKMIHGSHAYSAQLTTLLPRGHFKGDWVWTSGGTVLPQTQELVVPITIRPPYSPY